MSLNITQKDLERIAAQEGYEVIDQMNGPDLSAAVSNGPTGRQELEWANGPDLSSTVSDGPTGTVTLDTMNNVPLEHDEQVALFEWAERNNDVFRGVDLMFAIPNGGHRHARTGGILKAEGVKAGVPDIMLPVALAGYNGMFLEMKRADKSKSRVSDVQAGWIEALRGEGYYVAVCFGADEAQDVIKRYYGGEI